MQVFDLVGLPFKAFGRGPKEFDCWGLVQEIYRREGIPLPGYREDPLQPCVIDARISSEVEDWIPQVKPYPILSVIVMKFGQVKFCNHCGVLLSEDTFIHTREKIGVAIERLSSPLWRSRVVGFYLPSNELLERVRNGQE